MNFFKPLYGRLAIFSLLVLAATVLYWPAIAMVAEAVLHRQDSSHGVFVPFIAAFFIWVARKKAKATEFNYTLWAVPLFLAFAAAALFSIGSFQLLFICYVLAGLMSLLIAYGKQTARHYAFPILFLITAVPIPETFYNRLADVTRHITFGLSLKLISVAGVPFHRDGWLLELPNAVLEVGIACSGIRYLISFFVFGLAYAHLFRRSLLSKATVVIYTLPISMIAGALRLSTIFILTYHVSPRLAEHRPHVFISWMVFAGVLFGLIGLDQYISNKPSNDTHQLSKAK